MTGLRDQRHALIWNTIQRTVVWAKMPNQEFSLTCGKMYKRNAWESLITMLNVQLYNQMFLPCMTVFTFIGQASTILCKTLLKNQLRDFLILRIKIYQKNLVKSRRGSFLTGKIIILVNHTNKLLHNLTL